MLSLQRLVLLIAVFISMAAFPFLCCVPGTSRRCKKETPLFGRFFLPKAIKVLDFDHCDFCATGFTVLGVTGFFSLACVGIDFCLHSIKALSEKKTTCLNEQRRLTLLMSIMTHSQGKVEKVSYFDPRSPPVRTAQQSDSSVGLSFPPTRTQQKVFLNHWEYQISKPKQNKMKKKCIHLPLAL